MAALDAERATAIWRGRSDYALHAYTTRPHNLQIVSPALAEYLVEHFLIWGDTPRWQDRLAILRAHRLRRLE